jgi:hypothetical protein
MLERLIHPEDGQFVSKAVTAETWERFVAEVPWASPQHRAAWGEALSASFSFIKPEYRIFFDGARAVGGIPLMHFSVGGVLHSIQSSAFDSGGGPLVVDDYLENESLFEAIFREIDAHAHRVGAFEARLILPPTLPASVAARFGNGYKILSVRRNCPVLDLAPSLDAIVSGYESSVRRAVRKALKEGLEIEANADISRVEQAYPIYRATMERIGGSIKPWRFLKTLLESGLVVAFVARHQGKPVGLVLLLVTERNAIYWISANDAAQSQLRPTNALVDSAIAWCHAHGMRTFSFGESPGERSSLERFKLGWGSEIASSITWVRTYKPFTKWAWETLEPMARKAYGVLDSARGLISKRK